MSDRSNLRPMFQKMPRWLILSLYVLIALPLHLLCGMVEGWEEFKCEWQELRRIK